MPSVLLFLIMKVKALLNSPKKWIRGAFARNDNGCVCSVSSPGATQWCLVGAVRRCYSDPERRVAVTDALLKAIESVRGFSQGAPIFNDAHSTTFADIKKVLEIADV